MLDEERNCEKILLTAKKFAVLILAERRFEDL
jgi:hypothetical protein